MHLIASCFAKEKISQGHYKRKATKDSVNFSGY
jgi:hypothetical protein